MAHRLTAAELAASADVLDRLAEVVAKGEVTAPPRTVASLQGAAVALRATGSPPAGERRGKARLPHG